MPQMGVSVAEGTVVAWHKRAGDWVQADETLAEITTDKIDTEVPSPATGRLAEILVEAGVTVDVGVPLARIATDARPGEAHASETEPEPEPEPAAPVQVAERPRGRRYSPVVQRIAAEHGVDLEQVQGTGREGRVRKQDVLAHIEGAEGRLRPIVAGRRVPAAADTPSRRCTRPPTGPTAAGPAAALADAPRDRRAHEALARHRRDVHDLDRGRHGPRGARPVAARAHRAADRRARRDREPARAPDAQRVARGRPADPAPRRAPRHRRVARRGRAHRPGHPRRAGPQRRGAERPDPGRRAPRPGPRSSGPTRCAAARSRSRTRASTARSWPRRSSTSRRSRSSTSRRSSSGRSS